MSTKQVNISPKEEFIQQKHFLYHPKLPAIPQFKHNPLQTLPKAPVPALISGPVLNPLGANRQHLARQDPKIQQWCWGAAGVHVRDHLSPCRDNLWSQGWMPALLPAQTLPRAFLPYQPLPLSSAVSWCFLYRDLLFVFLLFFFFKHKAEGQKKGL